MAAVDSQLKRAELGVSAEQPMPIPEPVVEEFVEEAEFEPLGEPTPDELLAQQIAAEGGFQ